jgi:hypothetical protein
LGDAVVILRATQKVLRSLSHAEGELGASDNALGDWYVNRLVIDRRPLLLLVSSASRLAIVTPARDVKGLPERLAQTVGERLRRLGVSEAIVASEVEATSPVRVGKTVDRSVTGQLVDFAKALPYYLPIDGWDEAALISAESKLAETPCRASRPFAEVIWPRRAAIELLNAAWPASRTRH